MEIFTIDNINYKADRILDSFESVIWTERYYGDDHAELILPATEIFMDQVKEGMFLGCSESNVPMIIETIDFRDKKMNISAISILSWLNNRFIRTSPHADVRAYVLTNIFPSQALYTVIYDAISPDSSYLNGDIDTGILNPGRFAMPEILLDILDSNVMSSVALDFTVPFGPLYDAMREIAIGYSMGIQIVKTLDPFVPQPFRFRSYTGSDRTRSNTGVSPVRFSPEFDSLTNVEELRSLAQYKNCAIAFAPNVPEMNSGGEDLVYGPSSGIRGFFLRAKLIFADELGDPYPDGTYPTIPQLSSRLQSIATDSLGESPYIREVSGDAVTTLEHKYGVDYYLGDVVEVEGYTETINIARVTEYVRTQDASGKKEYPTFTNIGAAPTGPIYVPPTPEPAGDPGPPQNFGQLGRSISTARAATHTHPLDRDVVAGDGILVLATAPSNPLAGDPIGVPISCTDSAGNLYDLINTSKFEASSPAVNEGGVVCLFYCEATLRPLIEGTDEITVTWDNSVFDRVVASWIIRYSGGAISPTVLAKTSDNNTTVYAASEVKVTSPTWTPFRNGLEVAFVCSWRAVGASAAFGGVAGYDGFFESGGDSGRINFDGAKQNITIHQQTHGATVDVHTGAEVFETDLATLTAHVSHASFNGVGQQYYSPYPSGEVNKWKGIILLGIS